MNDDFDRRAFLKMLGVGGVVFAAGLPGCGERASEREPVLSGAGTKEAAQDFFFLQLSDTHWGFQGPPNPDAASTLPRAIEMINASPAKPDFVVFTGDLTQTTDDAAVRRDRMKQFRDVVSKLDVKQVRFLPGEHDASLDRGDAYRENFGDLHYAFDHKGLRFLALDNVSDPTGAFGDSQLDWLNGEVSKLNPGAPLVVLAHRPLFDLYPQWEWATKDGARAIEILSRHDAVSVFYGHIHQEHHHQTGAIKHHAARSLVFPLPPAGSQPKRAPLAWDPASKDHGLGYRKITGATDREPRLEEIPYAAAQAKTASAANARVIKVRAKKFEFDPAEVHAKVGEALVFEVSAADRTHGFSMPDFHVRADVTPGEPALVRVTPTMRGEYMFHCDVFCGDGHEAMSGKLIVDA